MDNTQFATLMTALDNVVTVTNNLSYQSDLILGAIFAVIVAAAYRWHL